MFYVDVAADIYSKTKFNESKQHIGNSLMDITHYLLCIFVQKDNSRFYLRVHFIEYKEKTIEDSRLLRRIYMKFVGIFLWCYLVV